jgi:hypothetical protein
MNDASGIGGEWVSSRLLKKEAAAGCMQSKSIQWARESERQMETLDMVFVGDSE